MKYLGILAIGTLAAACSSNSPPPAASAASVDAASNTPSTNADGAAAVHDETLASASDNRAATTGATGTGTSANAAQSGAATSAPSPAVPPSNAAAMPAQNPPSTAPDNTRINTRDRDSKALTPMDQGGSEGDRKITQQIRQAVMKDGSLSFTAKNVKIITINGKVTLRGPVKTDAERSSIEAAAKNVAGVAQVDNQLEIKN